jgi:hypothetical protein
MQLLRVRPVTASCHAVRVATRLIPLVQRTPAARLGDRDKQVSWLAAEVLASPSRILIQWSSMRGTPLTVAGAARAFTRVPFLIPFGGNLSRACKVPERAQSVNSAVNPGGSPTTGRLG